MRFLIVEDEEDIRDVLTSTIKVFIEDADFVEVGSGNEAIDILEGDTDFDVLLCDYNMPNGTGGDVFNYMIEKNLDMAYIFCSSDPMSSKEEFKGKEDKVFSVILKPDVFSGIEEFSKKYSDRNSDMMISEGEYCSVSVTLLLIYDVLPCDFYLKISKDKHIKVFKAGDNFSKADLEKYQNKEINELYVERTNTKKIFNFVTNELSAILDGEQEESEKTLNVHKLVTELGHSFGFSEELASKSQHTITKTIEMIESDKLTRKKLLNFLKYKGSYLSKHSVGVGYVSVAILRNLVWDSHDSRTKLALASFFHDIGIADVFCDERNVELKDLDFHIQESVNIFNSFNFDISDVDNIIAEHHELPSGKGIPKGLTATQIRPLSCIFIFSHLVIDTILTLNQLGEDVNHKKIVNYLENKGIYFNSGPFEKILRAFMQLKLFEDDEI